MSVDLWFTSLDSGISRQCSFKDGFCYLLKYAGFIIGYLFVSIFCIFWHVLRIWKNWFDSKDRLMSCSVSFDFLNAGLARDSTMVSDEWISNFFFCGDPVVSLVRFFAGCLWRFFVHVIWLR